MLKYFGDSGPIFEVESIHTQTYTLRFHFFSFFVYLVENVDTNTGVHVTGGFSPGIAGFTLTEDKKQIVSVVRVMENWLASESSGAEVAPSVQSACQMLGNYSASPDSVMHDQLMGR